jgi:subtilisin family serine protease
MQILSQASLKSRDLEKVYATALKGFAITMDENEAEILSSQPGIVGVWPDRMFILKKPGTVPVTPPAETLPYGISRVGYVDYSGSSVAWIIDTGIDLDHPDLNVDTNRSTTFVTRTYSGDDDNGHGSHCAGIVAAINNEIGVIGVASGATVVAVKVLDRRGSGAMSTIMAGVDYVAQNGAPGDVANMSLGGGVYEPLDIAVQNLGATGVLVALAAGNESDNANNHSPARANGANLYTVSAMDINDYWASFSNYGNPPIDYCAPGVSVFSLYKSGGYATMSGTSMAAPHVCGLLLITGGNINTDGYVNGDPDGNPDPIAHK